MYICLSDVKSIDKNPRCNKLVRKLCRTPCDLLVLGRPFRVVKGFPDQVDQYYLYYIYMVLLIFFKVQ